MSELDIQDDKISEINPEHSLCAPEPVKIIENAFLARSSNESFDIGIDPIKGIIVSIEPSSQMQKAYPPAKSPKTTLVLPSLCHPHVHLDKPYLLSHPTTAHLTPKSGDFKEALSLTSEAKKLYTRDSLLERGTWLIAKSMQAGVTHMRAFVEVDATVNHMCVHAGLELKRLWAKRCDIQICVFAQDPLFSGDHAEDNRKLLEKASVMEGVEVIGSTPYVEPDDEKARRNIEWAADLALRQKKHLDFHLDYFLDRRREPMIWHVLKHLKSIDWVRKNPERTVCLGHCTRLTTFTTEEWEKLAGVIKEDELPVYFIGLPTSDLFMMDRVGTGQEVKDRKRATLQVPWLIDKFELNASLSINNVGNAFTPQGSADPLDLASMGIGLYQTGTTQQAHMLYECISTRARRAIGLAGTTALDLAVGDQTNLLVYGESSFEGTPLHRQQSTVQDIVYDPPKDRLVVFKGQVLHDY